MRKGVFPAVLLFFFCWGRVLSGAAAGTGATEYNICRVRPALQITLLHGYTRARWQRLLTCEESGRCLEVRAEVGDEIPADGVYARIDPTFISLELKANRAACARLENLVAYWQHEVGRYRKLSGQQAVPLNRVEELEQKYDQARLQLAELKVKAEMLEERRRRCLIKAPPGWVLLERRAEPGEWLVQGRVVGRVGDYRTLLVPFSLTPEQYEWLRKKVAAGGICLLHGAAKRKIPVRLIHVFSAFNPRTRKIDIEFEVTAGLDEKRGGIGLDLAVELPEAGGVVVVPENALEERYDSCWLVREDGARVKVVKLGRSSDGGVRISGAGLRSGDRIRCRK